MSGLADSLCFIFVLSETNFMQIYDHREFVGVGMF